MKGRLFFSPGLNLYFSTRFSSCVPSLPSRNYVLGEISELDKINAVFSHYDMKKKEKNYRRKILILYIDTFHEIRSLVELTLSIFIFRSVKPNKVTRLDKVRKKCFSISKFANTFGIKIYILMGILLFIIFIFLPHVFQNSYFWLDIESRLT